MNKKVSYGISTNKFLFNSKEPLYTKEINDKILDSIDITAQHSF
jgi:hypothetical protein